MGKRCGRAGPFLIVAHHEPRDQRQAVAAGRTTLLITHRLAGLEAADEILVLRAGRIVERGRHHDLMQMGGLYRRMWDLQNQILLEGNARDEQ